MSRIIVRAVAFVAIMLSLFIAPLSGKTAAVPDGTPDTSFGHNGLAQIDMGTFSGGAANAIVALPNGDVVAVGATINQNQQPDDFALAGYAADGSLDSAFGVRGKVVTRFPYDSAGLNAAILLGDNKILAAGEIGTDLALARYNDNGTLDSSFGADGIARHSESQLYDEAKTVALQPDGKILAGGVSFTGPCWYSTCIRNGNMLLERFNHDGAIDSSFGVSGVVTASMTVTDTYYSVSTISKVVALDDGKILAVGNTNSERYFFARYNANGSLDQTFGDHGITIITLGALTRVNTILLDGADFLAAGAINRQSRNADSDFLLAKYHLDGTLDTDFGLDSSGVVTVNFDYRDDYATQMALLSDGKIALAGTSGDAVATARFNPDGTPDTGYGTGNGAALTLQSNTVNGMAVLADNRIRLVGVSNDGYSGDNFIVVGLDASGNLDRAFAYEVTQTGFVITRFNGADSIDEVHALAVQPDGKIVVVGRTKSGQDWNIAIARFNADGTPDMGFGSQGRTITDLGSLGDQANAVVIESNGEIVVVGGISPVNERKLSIAATAFYKPNGAFDYGGLLDYFNVDTVAQAILTLPDGNLLVGLQAGSDPDFRQEMLVRLTPEGSTYYFKYNSYLTFGIQGGTFGAMALQSDGKVIVAGYTGPFGASSVGFQVTRFNSDFTVDQDFYNHNHNVLAVPNADGSTQVRSILAQPDGKILLVGTIQQGGAIVRLNPNGSLDDSFGHDGVMLIIQPSAAVLQPDGKILVSGSSSTNPVARYLANGQRDPSFSASGGFKEFDPLSGMALLPGGDVVVAGTTYGYKQAGDFAVARFHNRPTFTDVATSDYFYDAVSDLAGQGIISGYGDNTFRPFNNTTRGQLAKIITLSQGWTLVDPATPAFVDVPKDSTFYSFIETAVAHNVISGYDTPAGREFRPGANVTRVQVAKIIVLAKGWALLNPAQPTFSDVPGDSAFYSFVETAVAHNALSGYDTANGREFRPGASATRGQIAKIVYQADITASKTK